MAKRQNQKAKTGKTYTAKTAKSAELRQYKAGSAGYIPFHSLGAAISKVHPPKR